MSCFLSPRVQTFVGIQEEHRISLAYFSTLAHRKSPCLYPFVTRDINRGTAYLGEGWQMSRKCQHFRGVLVGARKGQRADTQLILKWLKSYTQMHGVLIQVGSDPYMYCNFLTHILLHHIGVETFHRSCMPK